ncbi:MAG: AAA family ATPase [Actinobacteria bacterium]|nr:AAA family ATPase [Actinomycetota bacterium]
MSRYRFGDFVIDPETVEISGPDGVRDVEPQVFDVLLHLVEHAGRLVTKEELLDEVWGDRFVSESALTTRIKQARRSVDDDGTTQWAIKTVHGRGYRFVPEVTVEDGAVSADPGSGPPPEPDAAPTGDSGPAPPDLPEQLRADTRQRFCGREEELARCLDVVDQAARTDGYGWVWILGEPGIGKTRLAAEVAQRAADLGHRVAFGRNGEDLRVPFQPILEASRHLGHGDGPLAADALPNERAGVDDDTLRYLRFDAVASWLDDTAATTPLVLVVDDVHWAAESTLQLLGHLRRRPTGGAVTFVLTARDTAPDAHQRVADLIATTSDHGATTVVRLTGLSADAVADLVGADHRLDVADVVRQTAGNPLFVQAMDPADGSVDLTSAVHRRLATLDDQVQETLRLVSVLGLDFEVRVAAAATGRDELELLDDLERAAAARLVDDAGGDRFRFTHALVRSSLRSDLSSARRARLHARIATAIHDVHGDAPDHLIELAFHTAEAAESDRDLRSLAVDRLRRAAEESMEQLSFEEAADLLARARTLAVDAPLELRARLALEQGTAEHRAGDGVTASATFAQAIADARSSDDVALRVEAALGREDASWRPGLPDLGALDDVEEAIVVLDEALAAGEEIDGELELRAHLAVAHFRALAMAGRRDGVDEAFATARSLAAELGSPDVEANVLGVYLGQVQLFDDLEGGRPLVARLAALEPAITDGDVALHALHDRIMFATLTGDVDEREQLIDKMAALQARTHSPFWRSIRANQEAMKALYRGDLASAEVLAERCLDLADALHGQDGSGTFGLRMFCIRREQDRLAAMAPLVRHVLSGAEGADLWTPGLALLLAETGEPEEAVEVLAPVRSAGFDVPLDAMWSTVMVLLAEAVVQLDDPEACAMIRDRLARIEGSNVVTGSGLLCFGRADRYLGMLALRCGDLVAAEEHLGAALEGDAEGGSVLWSNESRLWLSRVRRAQGHPARRRTRWPRSSRARPAGPGWPGSNASPGPRSTPDAPYCVRNPRSTPPSGLSSRSPRPLQAPGARFLDRGPRRRCTPPAALEERSDVPRRTPPDAPEAARHLGPPRRRGLPHRRPDGPGRADRRGRDPRGTDGR